MSARLPTVFIGSSTEGLSVAKAVQLNLDHTAESVIWSQGVFGLSGGTLESLVAQLKSFDFAVLVLTPDDLTITRGESVSTPRDNVLFELGLFIGGIGRERTFLLVDRDAQLKLPSDLAGITPATYQKPERVTLQAALGAACTKIEHEIKRVGVRNSSKYHIAVSAHHFIQPPHQGIAFEIINLGQYPLPPYNIQIAYDNGGTYSMFGTVDKGEQLPDQHRDHRAVLLVSGKTPAHYPTLETDHEGQPLEITKFSFRLVLDKGHKVLYENRRIGSTFVKVYRDIQKLGDMREVTVEEWMAMTDKG